MVAAVSLGRFTFIISTAVIDRLTLFYESGIRFFTLRGIANYIGRYSVTAGKVIVSELLYIVVLAAGFKTKCFLRVFTFFGGHEKKTISLAAALSCTHYIYTHRIINCI